MRSKLIVMTALALALGGCNKPDSDRPQLDYTSSLLSRMSAADIDRVTTPPAPPERGPIPPNANAADPATNASLAFPDGSTLKSVVPPPGSDHSPEGERLAVLAQEASARAPDTASADEAKRKVYEDHAARGAMNADTEAKAAPTTAEAQPKPNSDPMAAEGNNPSSSEPKAATDWNSPFSPKIENT